MLATETGEPPEVAHAIELAGRLHDIGKCSVPDTVVGKPGQLTTEEVQIMQRHAGIGAEILSKTPIQSLPQAAAIARSHHEWWDGSGYPDGLAGEDIPLAARLVGMAETFDCLVHQRPYKRAWTADAALAEIAALSGKQFEPRLVDAFVRLVKRLIAEHDNIDEFLSHEAKKSQFLRTRANIASALRNAKPA
jgi:putative two-component system response regulator